MNSTISAESTSTERLLTGRAKNAVERWTPLSKASVGMLVLGQVALALAPLVLDAGSVDRLTTLFIYGILALMWNALAGYAGLVSVGHQAFFGLGAYAAVRIADAGVSP